MRKVKTTEQAGASLTELLIVIAIAAVLSTFAAALFGRSDSNFRRQNIAREFKVSLERARFDSVKRRASSVADMSTVKILSATAFSYTTDLNQNGRIDDPAETLTVDFGGRSDVRIVGNGLIFPVTIKFDQRGHINVRNGATAEIVPLFYFCNGSCTTSTANSSNSNAIYISPTGTVAMMKGGDTIPGFDNPVVTDVDGGTSVNPLLAVWVYEDGVAIPDPTLTPTPDLTPIPTPATTPIGTPTPTQSSCGYGEKPSLTGCVCESPMWVRTNGKCQ